MRSVLARALTAGSLVLGTLAWAPPAMAGCTTQVVPAFTVGVGGQDLATTPRIGIYWCGSTVLPTVDSIPTVTIEQYGAESYGIYADFPPGGGWIDWTFTIQVGDTTREVRVPVIPGGGGNRICLFFYGFEYHNPGNCLAHLDHP